MPDFDIFTATSILPSDRPSAAAFTAPAETTIPGAFTFPYGFAISRAGPAILARDGGGDCSSSSSSSSSSSGSSDSDDDADDNHGHNMPKPPPGQAKKTCHTSSTAASTSLTTPPPPPPSSPSLLPLPSPSLSPSALPSPIQHPSTTSRGGASLPSLTSTSTPTDGSTTSTDSQQSSSTQSTSSAQQSSGTAPGSVTSLVTSSNGVAILSSPISTPSLAEQPSTAPTPARAPISGQGLSAGAAVGIALGAFSAAILVAGAVFLFLSLRRRKRIRGRDHRGSVDSASSRRKLTSVDTDSDGSPSRPLSSTWSWFGSLAIGSDREPGSEYKHDDYGDGATAYPRADTEKSARVGDWVARTSAGLEHTGLQVPHLQEPEAVVCDRLRPVSGI